MSSREASQRSSPSMHDHNSPRGALSESHFSQSPAQSPAVRPVGGQSASPSGTTPRSSGDENNNTPALLTKVSELELVNDLLRRRISDLEASEAQAKRHVEDMRAVISEMQSQQRTQQPQQQSQVTETASAAPPPVVPESNGVKHEHEREERTPETEHSSHPHEAPQPPVSPASKRIKVSELI